jgi:hypothetical protein
MKDPSSAEFRNIEVESAQAISPRVFVEDGVTVTRDATGKSWKVTGEVNANNSFGGKVGFSFFGCEATLYDGSDKLKTGNGQDWRLMRHSATTCLLSPS